MNDHPTSSSQFASATPADGYAMAEQFLRMLDPDAERFEFRLIHDRIEGPPAIPFRGSLAGLRPLIVQRNTPEAGYGVFVTINQTDLKGRKAENIVRPRALFVDADSPEAVARVEEAVAQTGLGPSMRVCSSAGKMHFYWLTDDTKRDQFTPLQKALAQLFGGDPKVADLPHVMRLPGTLHNKDGPQFVTLQTCEPGLVYDTAAIVAALGLDKPSNVIPLPARKTAGEREEMTSDEFSVNDELGAGIDRGWFDRLPDLAKDEALRQMFDVLPDLALGGRDDWIKGLMAAHASGPPNAESLAREWSRPYPGYSDEEFDKDWNSFGRKPGGITIGWLIAKAAECGFDNLSWRAYAEGQPGAQSSATANPPPFTPQSTTIARGAPFTGGVYSPRQALAMMNARYAIVRFNNSGEVAIVRHGDGAPVIMQEQSVQLELSNIWVSDSDRSPKPVFEWWRNNKMRDATRGEIFDPKRPSGVACGPGEFNFWQGFGVEPVEGDDKIQRLLAHIAQIICNGDIRKWRYFVRWLAWTVQNPGRHPEVAIVLRSSAEGAGKSLLGELMVRIFGRHGLTVSDNCRLLGNHDEHLEFACFVLIEEALFAGDARVADKIKSRLTSNMVTINPKFRPARSVPNRMTAMLCTNHEWAVPAGVGARRWFIVDVSEARIGDKAYFDALHADLENGGDGQFLNYLLRLDLKDWHPRAVSRTKELALQQLASLKPVYRWLWECASSGRVLRGSRSRGDCPDLGKDVEAATMRDAFNDWVRDQGGRAESEVIIGKLLPPVLGPSKRATGGSRPRYYSLPDADELKRKIMDAQRIKLPASER